MSFIKVNKTKHMTCNHIYIYDFFFFWTALTAYVNSQARDRMGATAAGLCHSYSNVGSEPCLQPTLQLTAMPDPHPTERSKGLNPHPHGY